MITSPAKTHRHEAYVVSRPPISGPTATAIAAGGRDQAVGLGRSARPKFEATSATIAGMIRAAPIPSSSDQPMSSTVRFGASEVVSDPAP